MRSYSDPTANAALGAIEKEFRDKEKQIDRLKALRRKGKLSDEQVLEASRQFTGIFRHVFDEFWRD